LVRASPIRPIRPIRPIPTIRIQSCNNPIIPHSLANSPLLSQIGFTNGAPEKGARLVSARADNGDVALGRRETGNGPLHAGDADGQSAAPKTRQKIGKVETKAFGIGE